MKAFLALLTLVLAPAALAAAEWAIRGVTLVDGWRDAARSGVTVLIRGDRIAAIAGDDEVELSPAIEVVDGRGRFAVAGLWDMHVHVANRGDAELSSRLLPLFVAYGVVGVRDMGSDWSEIERLRRDIASGERLGPTLVAAGPFVDGPQPASPTVLPAADAAAAAAAVGDLVAWGVDFVKVQAKLPRDAYRGLAEAATVAGLSFAGHVPDALTAVEVSEAGQRSIEHLHPALPSDAAILFSCSREETGLRRELAAIAAAAGSAGADREELGRRRRALQQRLLDSFDERKAATVAAVLARNGTSVTPTLIWSETVTPWGDGDGLDADLPRHLVPAAARERWTAQRRRFLSTALEPRLELNRRMAMQTRAVVGLLHRSAVPILAGTDSYDAFVLPGFSLHQELARLVESGLTPYAALVSATRNAAEYLGRLDERGTLEEGKVADLLLLQADPLTDIRNTRRIDAVVLGGRYLSRERLDAVLAAAAEH